jgi:hypothetical protein
MVASCPPFPSSSFQVILTKTLSPFTLCLRHRSQDSPSSFAFQSTMSPVCAAKIDPLTVTVHELQKLLSAGSVTSVELVDLYLGQIQKHNHDGLKIHAIIETADRDLLVERAQQLDEERQQGKIPSPVHGIPIIVKVGLLIQVLTSLGIELVLG